jgi:energy-coupling factor transport system ATP-binding protein
VIKVDGLSFSYPATGSAKEPVEVLHDVSLQINKGEFLAIIGHNGSGKSTLAKHFNSMLLPIQGKVHVLGMDTLDLTNLWSIRQKVGMVFQNPDNQLVATVVEEDVAFGPENLGLPQAQIIDRVEEALTIVRMREFAKAAPHLLSGGQKQRVAIAGIIAMRPECIVLDEPTAMLDPVGREEVLETVQRLNREEGMTVVLITHFMHEAALADRIIVMSQGRIHMAGKPREIFSNIQEIKEIGLDVPQMTELAHSLRDSGINLFTECTTVEEMVDELCQYLSRT